MLRLFTASVALLLVACGTASRKNGTEAAGPRGRVLSVTDSAMLAGARDTVSFGNMNSGEIAIKELWIENRTSKPLVISAIQRNCGCVDLKYDPRPLLEGESRRVELSFDTRGERGWKLKVMDLRIAGFEKAWRLYVDADIR